MKFNPGPGVGGHCIPVDPYYLTWSAEQAGFTASFIEKANEINQTMPKYVVERFISIYGPPQPKEVVLVAGIAYKPGVADIRESPGIEILHTLQAEGYTTQWYDPFVKSANNGTPAKVSEYFSGVIITLPGQDLPINSWLSSGCKILDCTGFYRSHEGVIQL